MAFIFSSVVFWSDRTINGICTVYLLFFICSVRIIPLMLGTVMSIIIRFGGSCFTIDSPSSLFGAVKIVYSSDSIFFSVSGMPLLLLIIKTVISAFGYSLLKFVLIGSFMVILLLSIGSEAFSKKADGFSVMVGCGKIMAACGC